jgi:hypothetical protein
VTPRNPNARDLATPLSPELAAEFAAAGVHRLVLLAPETPDGPAQTIEAGLAAISGL